MSVVSCRWMAWKLVNYPKQLVRLVQTANFARKVFGCTTLGTVIAKCESGPLDMTHLRDGPLTHEQCIKQACLLSVNSASTLLTTTSSALLDTCKEYKNSLYKIMFLLEELQTIEDENPALWDEIVEARAELNKAKATLSELNSFMESVEKVVNSTTEASFLAGAEYMCTALCERLYSAQREINNQIMELKQLEADYVKVQKEIVSKKGNENKEKTTKQEIKASGKPKKNIL